MKINMLAFFLISFTSAAISPIIGWGGTISLNSQSTAVCQINNVRQSLQNKCLVTCPSSGTSTVTIRIISSTGTETQLYTCTTRPTVTSVDFSTFYSSSPVNLTVIGTNFFFFPNNSIYCSVGSSLFSAIFVNSTSVRCFYSSVKAGNYVLSVLPNGVDSVGALSVRVLNSYRFSKVFTQGGYLGTGLIVVGKGLDTDLVCVFSNGGVKVTAFNSSVVTCNVPASLNGNLTVFLQNSAGMVVSGVFYFVLYLKVTLRSAGPVPVTNYIVEVDYTGTLIGTVYCVVNSIKYSSTSNNRQLNCDLTGLSPGDYSLSLRDDFQQISTNSLTIYLRKNEFNASFQLNSDLLIYLNSALTLFNVYCKWGKNPAMKMTNIGSLYTCKVQNVLDKGDWCVELSNDGQNFSDSCLFQYNSSRKSNFLNISPEKFVLSGDLVKITFNKLYQASYECSVNGLDVPASVNDSFISCVLPEMEKKGTYSMNVLQNGTIVKTFQVIYVNFVEISAVVPEFVTSLTSTLTFQGEGFYEGIPCFLNGSELSCTYLNTSFIKCSIPKVSSSVIIECLNINNLSSSPFNITYRPIPVVSNFKPSTLFEGLVNSIYILGSDFRPNSFLKFLEEQVVIETSFINDQTLHFTLFLDFCNSSSLKVSLTPNKLDYNKPFTLPVKKFPCVTQLSFYRSPYWGGDVLEVFGNGFIEDMFCDFGGVLSEFFVQTYESGNCTVPYHDVGIVEFSLYFPGLYHRCGRFNYSFDDLVEFQLDPDTGPLSGGTVVKILADFSYLDGPFYCIFAQESVEATSSNPVTCVTPPGLGQALVKVKSGTKLYSSYKPVYFYYTSYPELVNLSISSSPSFGNSSVIITGTGFDSYFNWECLFGSFYVQSIFLSESKLLCRSPGQSPRSVQVVISNNRQDKSNFLDFSYTSDMSILKISPELGPATGSTTVTLTGKKLENAVYCKIGLQVFTGVTSNGRIQCVTQSFWYGSTEIELSTNALDFTRSRKKFLFVKDFQVTSVWPPLVPNNGTTVVIKARNVPSGLRCRVGSSESSVVYFADYFLCTIPASSSVSVELTVNSQNYQSFYEITTLRVYPNPTFTSLSQAFMNVNSYVKLVGSALIPNIHFSVRFGNISYFRVISSNSIVFKVPYLPFGTYTLQISNNNQDFINMRTALVSDLMQVITAVPVLVSVRGGTVVTIRVENAVNSIFSTCLFSPFYENEQNYSSSFQVPATFINSTHINCTTPTFLFPGYVYLRVSNDNQQYSSSSFRLEVFETCKDRVICSGNTVSSCPLGTFCLESFWYSSTSCPVGTYQNQTLQTSCFLCPKGQICTSSVIPSSCPFNFTCSVAGLAFADYQCKEGFYCPLNTSMPDLLCRPPQFCRGTNQTCMDGFICKRGAENYYGEAACPEGFYCVGYSIHVCPARFYCKGTGNAKPVPCPPGTYNSLSGQSECKSCPVGSVCPHSRLFRPVACPKGYICDTEGLTFPVKLCTPGYYCPEGVNTAYLETPCYAISQEDAFDSSFCGYNIMVLADDDINFSGNVSQFGFNQSNLCCWNSSRTSDFISGISGKKVFQDLGSYFFNKGYIGMQLYTENWKDDSKFRRRLVDTGEILDELQDKETFYFYVFQLLNLPKPRMCKAGVFCLEGVMNDTVIDGVVRSGKTCNPGTYCMAGSSTPAGTLCPAGFHCPSGSSEPTPNSPGSSTGFAGNVFEGTCSPNYFANQNSSSFCYNCPDGYQCTKPGTIWPMICPKGYYRDYMQSSICSECPLSSFSFDFGIISERECQPCSAGRMCLLAGTANISLSSKCTQGEYCEEAADISMHEKCPPGFLCDAATTPEDKFGIPCITGFYCPLGMKFLNKYLYPCPEYAYCPPATYDYSIFYANPEKSNATSYEYPPTHCPKGTGKVSEGSRSNLLMCQMKEVYTSDNPIFEINPIIPSISANFSIISQDTSSNSSSSNSSDSHRLPEAWVFHLSSRQVSLITFDLKHINSERLTYGVDWAISFTILDSISDASSLSPVPMPQSFLRESVDKTNILEFSILAWTALDFKVSILIYNGLFHAYHNLFENTTSVEIFTPNRGYYGSTDTFLTMIDNTVALPFNNPNPDVSLSFYLLTFAPSPERANLERVQKVNDENWFQPNTKFWGDNSAMFLPYFPYFSNCKGYGQFIPIWAPLELSPECQLIDPAQTKPIIPFYFGSKPVADNCLNVIIECVFDELIGDTQALPRWFELEAFITMFYLTQLTVPEGDFLSQATAVPLIAANTQNAVPSGSLPNLIEIQILYQQFDIYTKRVILVLITFLNFTSLSGNQQLGIDQTSYNLSLVYRAMDQKELLINFIFDYTFYFTLFVLVGIITLGFTMMFWVHHKAFTDVKPKPKFLFINYFILKLRPPFEGFMVGFIPIFAIFCINSYLMIGYLLGDFFKVAGDVYYVNNGIFDSMMPTYKDFTTLDPANVQRARLGTSLVATGAYIMWIGASLFVLDDQDEPSEEQSGNIWSFVKWRRMNLIFASIISIAGLQGLVQMSYSAVFGLYSYVFIVVLFVVGNILGYYLVAMLTDELLAEPVNQAVGMVTGIATFGASDFVNFLTGYFVGLMNLFVMRLYLDFINEWATGLLEAFFDKLGAFQYAVTDLNSYRNIFNRLKSMGSMAPIDEAGELFEPSELEILENYDSDEDEVEEENSYYTYEDVPPSPVVPEPEGEPLDEQEFESLLGHIIGYSGDLLGYFYNPIFTIMCWNYYDYIPFFSAYGIAKPDVFLYVMFGTVMIPFQLATDIILHNANELYNGWAVHDFLDFMKEKYANRKKRWVGSDPQNEEIIDDPIKNVYRVCFTPHFFFMSTIFDSGFCFSSIGFVTILNNEGYNAFDDRATIPIILFSVILCWVVKKISLFMGNLLHIWYIKNEDFSEVPQDSQIDEPDAIQLFNEIYVPKVINRLVPEIPNWPEIEIVKASDEILKRDIDPQVLTDPKVKEKFLEVNQEWLQENLSLIFSDENFDENRGIILTKLAKMYGFIQQPTDNRRFPELEILEPKIENPSVISIAKYWLARAQRNRNLMIQVSVVLEEMKEDTCIYCRSFYMLQCELLENVEELFFAYKKGLRYRQRNKLFEWNHRKWMNFVRENGHFRTICLECLIKCEDFHRYSANFNKRSQIRKDLNEGINVHPDLKHLALHWLGLARDNLNN